MRTPAMIAAIFIFAIAVSAQTTAFTYQGRLNDSTVAQPTNGSYDIVFRVFDALAGGNQQGGQIQVSNVAVVNGVFTVQLDFGTVFISPTTDLFLEILVRPAGPQGPYTTLAPRQQVTSAPFAVQARNAALASDAQKLGGTNADQFITILDPRLTDARTPTPGSTSYIQNTNALQTASFHINGDMETDGTVKANLISGFNQINLSNQRVFYRPNSNSIFIGANAGNTLAPGNNMVMIGTNSGVSNSSGSSDTFVGSSTGTSATSAFNTVLVGYTSGATITTEDDNTLVGANTDIAAGVNSSTAIGIGAKATLSHTIVLGTLAETVVLPNLGAAGSTQLCRNANFQISTCSSSLRYKTNIAAFDSGLEMIKRLQPITFDWKADGMHDLGFGAEEVARVSPLLVTYNSTGAVEGVKYDRVGVVLVNAMKEQQAQIEAQARQIAELKAVVCSLKPDAAVCK